MVRVQANPARACQPLPTRGGRCEVV